MYKGAKFTSISLFSSLLITGVFLFLGNTSSAQELQEPVVNPHIPLFEEALSERQYSIYEPVHAAFLQNNKTLTHNEFFQDLKLWNSDASLELPYLQDGHIYSFVTRSKKTDGKLSGFSEPHSFVYQRCTVSPEIMARNGQIYLQLNPHGNPEYTRYAIYVPERQQYVQADGSFGDAVSWLQLSEWDRGQGIIIREPKAYEYSFQVKARGMSGDETALSQPRRLQLCDTLAGLNVDIDTHALSPKVREKEHLFTSFSDSYALTNTLLAVLVAIAIISLIYYLRISIALQNKKRVTKQEKANVRSALYFLFYTLILVGIILFVKLLMLLTFSIYTLKAPNTYELSYKAIPMTAAAQYKTVSYTVSIENVGRTQEDLNLYHAIPSFATLVPGTLTFNGHVQSDAKDEDVLHVDAENDRIGIDLPSVSQNETITFSFIVETKK